MEPKIAVIFRSYAKTPDNLQEMLDRAHKSAVAAFNCGCVPYFCIPIDYDCGKTKDFFKKGFLKFKDISQPDILECPGYHSSGALNKAIAVIQKSGDYTHVAIVSNKASGYLVPETIKAITDAINTGAKVVGVIVDEIICESRIQNTFAVWDIEALMTLDIPGFDNETGIEEIAPIVRLIRKYGPCIAVLNPTVGKLNIRTDGKDRHHEVITTKQERQEIEVKRVNTDFDFIQKGIMKGYPKKI
ncbi:MAG: hypothetical protein HY773_01940 [Candidatus Terrybacteria bacterium]|nr:hypothetical protein [Candidatus Terrybacteria bacterium]